MFGRNEVIGNGIKKHLLVLLMFGLCLSAWAGGSNEPALNVRTPSESSRLVLMDWSRVRAPERTVYGLYRFDRAEKSYTLMQKVTPNVYSVLDENLDTPLSNYFYKIESVQSDEELHRTNPIRISESEMREQLASSYFVNNFGSNVDTRGAVKTTLPIRPASPSNLTNARYNSSETYTGALNDGIYVGLVVFAGKAVDLTRNYDGSPGLVSLDPAGRQVLLEHLALGYVPQSDHGTALYYAEHKAIAALTELDRDEKLPANVDSVSIITFTDGIDTSSTDADFAPLEGRDFRRSSSGTSYRNYISGQLQNRRIAGKQINAWSIGIRGRDVQNGNDFSQTLQSLSSGEGTVTQLDNLSGIEEQLLLIADGLNIWTPQIDLTISTPAYPVGTIIRLTFDDWITTPNGASYYIDARVGWADNNYVLNKIESSGITLNNFQRITGRRVGSSVEYLVTVNNEFNIRNIKQWYVQLGEESVGWQSNSEFALKKSAAFKHNRKTALVYLVLDCSSSLKPAEIAKIRQAVDLFIDRLYNTSSRAVRLPEVGNDAGYTNVFYPEKNPQHLQQPTQLERYAQQTDRYGGQQTAQDNFQRQKQQVYSVPSRTPPKREAPPSYQQQPTRAQRPPQDQSYQAVNTPRPNNSNPGRGFWIQVGSYTDLSYAQKAWRQVAEIGYDYAEIFYKETKGTTLYRVKVGPYATRNDAESTLTLLRNASPIYNDCFIAAE